MQPKQHEEGPATMVTPAQWKVPWSEGELALV